ncbi:MAG: alanine racemase [Bacillota bacterium]
MKCPRIEVRLSDITFNAEQIIRLAQRSGVEVVGVTKAFHGDVNIARAMLEGGIKKLADSRLASIATLRKAFPSVPVMLIRSPGYHECEEAVRLADVSLISSVKTAEWLDQAAKSQGVTHDVVLMVDLGDLREGVLPEHAVDVGRQICALRNVRLVGLGAELGCIAGVLPSPPAIHTLRQVRAELQSMCEVELDVMSPGSSSALFLLEQGEMPDFVNQLRIGSVILTGTDDMRGRIIPWLRHHAFMLVAELLEVYTKHSAPFGPLGTNAFGEMPVYEDLGMRKRGILSLGRVDCHDGDLTPLDEGVRLLGISSDHAALDLTDCRRDFQVGDEVAFHIGYTSIVRCFTSPFVHRYYIR